MKTFDLRFISEGSILDGIIEVVEGGSMWSHTEIIIPDGRYLGARIKGGVQIRPADYCKVKREERYSIPVEDAQYEQIMDFAHAQIGKPYDYEDIIGIAVQADWHNLNRWICSEFVAASAEAGGLYLLNVIPKLTYRITPEELHLSPSLRGNLKYSFGV